jgi:CheY-like chemotaxis protein
VQSILGEGSVFALNLPAAPAPALSPGLAQIAADLQAATPKRPGGLRVLAAEDHAVNRMVLESLLEPRGVALTLVPDGAQAVEAYENGEFDLILMDIQMPVMSGIEATRAIRAIEAQSGRVPVPILAVTANVLSHQREAYVAVGIDGCVAKPIGAARLHQAIDDALAASARGAETKAAAQEPRTAAHQGR